MIRLAKAGVRTVQGIVGAVLGLVTLRREAAARGLVRVARGVGVVLRVLKR